jgi:hypothetical protein
MGANQGQEKDDEYKNKEDFIKGRNGGQMGQRLFLQVLRREKQYQQKLLFGIGQHDEHGDFARYNFKYLNNLVDVISGQSDCALEFLESFNDLKEDVVQVDGKPFVLQTTEDLDIDQPRNKIPYRVLTDDDKRIADPVVEQNVFFNKITNELQAYEAEGKFPENRVARTLAVSIAMSDSETTITPYLFAEHHLKDLGFGYVDYIGSWRCCKTRCTTYTLKTFMHPSMHVLLKQQLSLRQQTLDHVNQCIDGVMRVLSVLKQSDRGFVHGNLTMRSIFRGLDGTFALNNLENSSFYVNGYRFYRPYAKSVSGVRRVTLSGVKDFVIQVPDEFFKQWKIVPNRKHYNLYYYQSLAKHLSDGTGISEVVTTGVVNYLTSAVTGVIDELTNSLMSTGDPVYPGINKLNIINRILIQNNPIRQAPMTYDIYTFFVSLFSEDYMYVNVMRFFDVEKNQVKFNLEKCQRYILEEDNSCRKRIGLLRIWKMLWFDDDFVQVTMEVKERGKRRMPLLEIDEVNEVLMKYKLKVNLCEIYDLIQIEYFEKIRVKLVAKKLVTASENLVCLERPIEDRIDGKLKCVTEYDEYDKKKFSNL